MFSIDQLLDQAIKDGNSARLDAGETEALISWGVKFKRYLDWNENYSYELIVAYEGDMYKKLPDLHEHVLKEYGWKKGVLSLALARCNDRVRTYEARIRNVDGTPKADNKKYIDTASRALENAINKSQSIQLKINNYE